MTDDGNLGQILFLVLILLDNVSKFERVLFYFFFEMVLFLLDFLYTLENTFVPNVFSDLTRIKLTNVLVLRSQPLIIADLDDLAHYIARLVKTNISSEKKNVGSRIIFS